MKLMKFTVLYTAAVKGRYVVVEKEFNLEENGNMCVHFIFISKV